MNIRTRIQLILGGLTLMFGAVSLGIPAVADSHPMSDGVIRKIDMKQGKVTIKHGEIANLEMPPMSMVFTVEDASMLDALAKGDEVRFVAIDKGGKFFVTEIELAK